MNKTGIEDTILTDSFDKLIETDGAGEAAAPEKGAGRRAGLKTALLAGIVALCVLALLSCAAAVWGYSISVGARSLPNVYVDAVPVGSMTRTEIAAALHRKPAAVRKRLSRALKTLRGMLDKEAL